MQKSPFNTVHSQLNANFADYDGWSLPSDFGDIHSEIKALSNACGVVDLCSFGRIQINGKTAKETIIKLFNTGKGDIKPESWDWASPVGYSESTKCRIFCLNGSYTLLTQPSQTESLCAWLQSAASDDISVTDITSKTAMLGLYGPKAFESMKGVLPFDIDHLDIGDVEKMSFMMLSFTLLRGSWLDAEGLELICPAAAGPIAAGAVAKYRHKHNITPVGMEPLSRAIQQKI
jgi:aminomethyltransferase